MRLKYIFFFYQACNKYNGYSDFVQYFSEYTTMLYIYKWHFDLLFWFSHAQNFRHEWSKKKKGERHRFVWTECSILCCWPWIMMSKVHCKNVSHEIYPPLQKMLFLSTPNNHREIINQFFDPGSDLEVGGTARCGVMIYVWWSQYLCFKLQ